MNKYAIMVNSGSSANLLATFASCNPLRKNKFKIGDEVFVEGIQAVDGDEGTGFNSAVSSIMQPSKYIPLMLSGFSEDKSIILAPLTKSHLSSLSLYLVPGISFVYYFK